VLIRADQGVRKPCSDRTKRLSRRKAPLAAVVNGVARRCQS